MGAFEEYYEGSEDQLQQTKFKQRGIDSLL